MVNKIIEELMLTYLALIAKAKVLYQLMMKKANAAHLKYFQLKENCS
jgi:hypothetical protein